MDCFFNEFLYSNNLQSQDTQTHTQYIYIILIGSFVTHVIKLREKPSVICISNNKNWFLIRFNVHTKNQFVIPSKYYNPISANHKICY